jgi:hypothetical protein
MSQGTELPSVLRRHLDSQATRAMKRNGDGKGVDNHVEYRMKEILYGARRGRLMWLMLDWG